MDKNHLHNLRHSAAHLLAASVLRLWPDTKLTIGPAIENGFYYDFDFSTPISENDLPKIEKKMADTLVEWHEFTHRVVTPEEAKELYQNNSYKKELIDEIVAKGEPITLYKAGRFEDLCKGGHCEIPNKEIAAFKLLSVAGAYWRGSEKNPMLTRIYGTAFSSQKELDDYLTLLEEAKKRDHKKLGKELDLFVFSETVGKGLPLFTPKGATIRRELERFIVDEEIKRGYLHVYTPDIARLELYKKSGHYPYYKDSMYAPIQIEDEDFMLRPMTCPHHFELYLATQHSYRELPMRIAELAKLYRFEKSGELMGLQRVRTFCLADSHIITPKKNAEEEIHNVLDLIEYIASVFHLTQGTHYSYRLSLGDRTDEKKYFKDDASWDFAEQTLRKVLLKRNAHFVEAPQEAAFYGPKIDIQMKNANGKEDTAFTVQYDFVMPTRFDLSFINEQGEKEQPVVIHRSSIGAIERVMAFLIEHFEGKFPLWLAPIQIELLPIADRHLAHAQKLHQILQNASIRSEINSKSGTLQGKIREATLQKVPYIGIIGDKEVSGETLVSIRNRNGDDEGSIDISNFVQKVKEEIDKKA